jgi:hypothetical protein
MQEIPHWNRIETASTCITARECAMAGKVFDVNEFRRKTAERVMQDSQAPVRFAMARNGSERGAQVTGAKSVEPMRRFSKGSVAHFFQFFFACIMHWRSGVVMKRGRMEGFRFLVSSSRGDPSRPGFSP